MAARGVSLLVGFGSTHAVKLLTSLGEGHVFLSPLYCKQLRAGDVGRNGRRKQKTSVDFFHSNSTLLISGVCFGVHLYIVYSQVSGHCTHARSEQKNRN